MMNRAALLFWRHLAVARFRFTLFRFWIQPELEITCIRIGQEVCIDELFETGRFDSKNDNRIAWRNNWSEPF